MEDTYASPSSSESFWRLLAFFPPVFFVLDLLAVLPAGDPELSLLIAMGASSSSEDASPARARSSSSMSAMVKVALEFGSDGRKEFVAKI